MDTSLLWRDLAFAAVVVPLVLSPGPSVLWIVAQRLSHGRRAVAPTIAGDLSANFLQLCVTAAGISAIAASVPTLFSVLRALGVAWLIVLAARQWRAGAKRGGAGPDERTSGTMRAMFARSFVTSGVNPKAILFFLAVPPLFVVSEQPLVPQLATLGATFLLLDGLALWGYAAAVGKMGDRIRRFETAPARISAVTLLAAAAMLAMARL